MTRGVDFYSEDYWSILALARFVLAAIVFLAHLEWFIEIPGAVSGFASLGGKAAVLGFLLISGVSIGRSYALAPSGFYRRRFLRIYPLYVISVLSSCMLIFALGNYYSINGHDFGASGWRTGLANAFFLQGFIAITVGYNLPLWSLSVEVFYYMAAPFLSKSTDNLVLTLTLLSMCFFVFPPHDSYLFGYVALRYAWAWLLGYSYSRTGPTVRFHFLWILGALAVFYNRHDTAQPLSVVTFLAIIGVIVFSGYLKCGVFFKRLFNFLGDQSYPLYLFHMPIYFLVYGVFGLRGFYEMILITLVVTFVLNVVFDVYLKRVFWIPVVHWIGGAIVLRPTK